MSRLFRSPAVVGLVIAIAAFFCGMALRYGFYEPDIYGAICYEQNPWWCVFRTAIAVGSKRYMFGWISEALMLYGAFMIVRGRALTWPFYLSAAIGGLGLMLYDQTVSAPAVLLSIILLVRAPERAASARS
jgi:hypothetical protein